MPYTQVKTFWGFPASEAGAQALDNDINSWLSSKPDIEVLHIGQSQSQAADHGAPRVTISIFYKSALPPVPPPLPPSQQETLIISKPQQARKSVGRTEAITAGKSRPLSPKPAAPAPAPSSSLPSEEGVIRRRKEAIRQLEEAATRVKSGDTLKIGLRDSIEIRRLQVSDLIDRGYETSAAENVVQAIQRGNFNPLGLALKGIGIVMIEGASDLLALDRSYAL